VTNRAAVLQQNAKQQLVACSGLPCDDEHHA